LMTLPNLKDYKPAKNSSQCQQNQKKVLNSLNQKISLLKQSVMSQPGDIKVLEKKGELLENNLSVCSILKHLSSIFLYEFSLWSNNKCMVSPGSLDNNALPMFDLKTFLSQKTSTTSSTSMGKRLEFLVNRYHKLDQELDTMCQKNCKILEDTFKIADSVGLIVYPILSLKKESINKIFIDLKRILRDTLEKAIVKVIEEPQDRSSFGKRFSQPQSRVLWSWFFRHISNPYPTEDEKQHLSFRTRLEPRQIATWFSNQRERYKQRILDELKRKEKKEENEENSSDNENEIPHVLQSVTDAKHGCPS
jgi:hypothetical protein